MEDSVTQLLNNEELFFDERINLAELPKASSTEVSLSQLRAKACKLHFQNNLREAITYYKLYLTIEKKDAFIWNNLGSALFVQGLHQSALICHRRALQLDSQDLSIRANLAKTLKNLGQLNEAIALYLSILQQQPDNISIVLDYACALREAARFEAAVEVLEDAQNLEPDNLHLRWEQAQSLLNLDYTFKAWCAYEARWGIGEIIRPSIGSLQWHSGYPLKSKTIIVYAEQSLSDTILAARYISLLKQYGANITLACKSELHSIFLDLGADEIIPQEKISTKQYDFQLPLMSAMGAFKTTKVTVPPPAKISISQISVERFTKAIKLQSGKINVGVVWSDSLATKNDEGDSLLLQYFLTLAEVPNVQLYSLQKGHPAKQIMEYQADIYIVDIGRYCENLVDTAAAISFMDVIVCVDSVVAHLAASMGKRVVNLLSTTPCWFYGAESSKTPWYPTMELIRYQENTQCSRAFDDLRRCLGELC